MGDPGAARGPKGKTAAGKRLCHHLAISAATQIQSFLFLLVAARLPQQAACVAISIPAWTWNIFLLSDAQLTAKRTTANNGTSFIESAA